MVQIILTQTTLQVCIEKVKASAFETNIGDSLSPILFNCYYETAMRDLRPNLLHYHRMMLSEAFLQKLIMQTWTSLALIHNIWSLLWKYVQTTFLSGTCKSIETRLSALEFTWLLKALPIMVVKPGGR